ncbi:MAG TPA: P-II family nitrogen regulator [Syntrophales bacterium]|nr:P-II family nitrogen regulator [Syntrophales bacterium]
MNEMDTGKILKLVVTIVAKGAASKVVAASKNAGAKGGTILLGRGTAPESVYLDILGINFDPERELVLTLAGEDMTDRLLQTISDEGELHKPGKGIAFVVDVKGLVGMISLLKTQP